MTDSSRKCGNGYSSDQKRHLSPEFSYFSPLLLKMKSTVKYIIFVLLKIILSHFYDLNAATAIFMFALCVSDIQTLYYPADAPIYNS